MIDHKLQTVTKQENGQLKATFVSELTGNELELFGDQVIVEHGTMPADDVYQELRNASNNDGVLDVAALLAGRPQPCLEDFRGFSLFRIGDAASSRNLAAAMYDALRLCSVM